MAKQTFKEIRAQYPSEFLLLLDYEEQELPDGQFEVVAAEGVKVFGTGEEMMRAYKDLRKSGRSAMFCTPEYTDRLVIDHIPAIRM